MSVLVYTENWDGKFKKLTHELVSYAKAVANMLGTTTTALSIGNVAEDELKTLGNFGADKIISVNDDRLQSLVNAAFTKIITQAAEKEGAQVVIFSNNNSGKALAPGVSVRLKAGLVAGVVAPPSSTDPFIVKKAVFTGKAFANVKVNSAIKVLSLALNSFGVKESPVQAALETLTPELNDGDFTTEVKDVNKVTGKVLLSDAEIVISGGRGMKGPENWGPIEELAELFGGATACSRPVSDEGWRPHSEHTGQTGKIIAPNLYIAAGISGAIQHVAGVSASKCLVAINKDADAPIFESADYGIVGDALKILPQMVEAVKELKAEG